MKRHVILKVSPQRDRLIFSAISPIDSLALWLKHNPVDVSMM